MKDEESVNVETVDEISTQESIVKEAVPEILDANGESVEQKDPFEEYIQQGCPKPENEEEKRNLLCLCEEVIDAAAQADKSASVAIFIDQKYELFSLKGYKTLEEHLAYLEYSKGTISHKVAYGKFCVSKGLRLDQLPSEFALRSLLPKRFEKDRDAIYNDACRIQYESIRKLDKDANNHGDDREKSESSDSDSKSELKAAGNDSCSGTPMPPRDLLDYAPNSRSIELAIENFLKSKTDTIFLSGIDEAVSINADFSHDVLEAFRGKIKSVPILTEVVRSFRLKKALTANDTDFIRTFSQELHDKEFQALNAAIEAPVATDVNGEQEEKLTA